MSDAKPGGPSAPSPRSSTRKLLDGKPGSTTSGCSARHNNRFANKEVSGRRFICDLWSAVISAYIPLLSVVDKVLLCERFTVHIQRLDDM